MVITSEKLAKQIADLQGQLVQLQANTHAAQGAIQVCEHLLMDLDQPEPPVEEVT